MCKGQSFNKTASEYYYLSLLDLLAGIPFEEIEKTVQFYEDIENYEACHGILKALNEAENYTLKQLENRIIEYENNPKGTPDIEDG